MTDPLSFATHLARRSGGLLIDYFQNTDMQGQVKPDHSIVTEADLATDQIINNTIRSGFPEDLILSEELQPSLESEIDRPVWIIDPIDGTTNFSVGLHVWGVLITRLINGWPDLTVMYFPLIEELYSARRGTGAYLNGKHIQPKSPVPNYPANFFACCSRTYRDYHVTVPYKPRILGSAAYNFCSVARGTAVVAFEATPKIWDIAGAWLLVTEAGGVIDTHDGSKPFPLLPGEKFSQRNYPTLAAATRQVVESTRTQLEPKQRRSD